MSTIQQEASARANAVGNVWVRRGWPWLACLIIALLAPMVFSSGHDIHMLSSMAIMMVFALSYNMLLGNTGLLSFGHAVYFGFGAYIAMHAVRWSNDAVLDGTGYGIPIELIPLVGGLAGLFFGILFGSFSTKKAGVVFAMISLGIVGLVEASSLAFTGFFGGEAGLFGDREDLNSLLGIAYGRSLTVYYLMVFWLVVCALLMYLLKQTPLGWMANAVRDNPERAQFVGYSTTMVRFLQFSLSAFFAGVAGGMFVLVEEIVTDEAIGFLLSGEVLLAAYIGGIGFFFGPIVGAALVVYLESNLSAVTDAWLLYFGVLFIAVVMFAPMGIVGILFQQWANFRAGGWKGTLPARLYCAVATLVGLLGFVCIVELAYHYLRSWDPGRPMTLLVTTVDATTATPWLVSAAILALGLGLLIFHARPMLKRAVDAAGGGK
ncbi:MAG: branched-chain amino acid ABC transporter permease [Ectothiorhodospiraceae bacterium]|nr:branched-chain amino acid ABC transporter permease [Ectothiorhodospiraceae bacterium]